MGILFGAVAVYSITPSLAPTISGGIFAGAPTYTIWAEGSNYFAKSATGNIDFSGTNESEIIQSCIADDRTILLKSGSYTLDVMLIDGGANNVILEGEGNATELILGSGVDSHVIDLTDVDGWTITNLKIDANKDEQTDSSIDGIHLLNVDYCTIEKVTVIDAYDAGIMVSLNCKYINVRYNLVQNSSGNGIYFYNYPAKLASYSIIENNRVQDAGLFGIAVTRCIRVDVKSNQLTTGYAGMIFYTTDDCSAEFNIVRNTTGVTVGAGIELDDTCQRNRVIGNQIYDVAGRGIVLYNASNYNIIDGNHISSGEHSGVEISESHYNVISSNFIEKNARHGIHLYCATYNAIGDNIIRDNSYGDVGTYDGIEIGDDTVTGSIRNSIVNNIIRDTQGTHTQAWGIDEKSLGDYTVVVGATCILNTVGGIKKVGANTKVNLCWNATTWIP